MTYIAINMTSCVTDRKLGKPLHRLTLLTDSTIYQITALSIGRYSLDQSRLSSEEMKKKEEDQMDIIKYIYNELSCFIKLTLDLIIQKVTLILRRNSSGL